MCTAATYQTEDFYFGRTLDYMFSYGEEIVVTPRNVPFHFRDNETIASHYAMIGMAHVAEEMPLYYDAVNEKGLGMAGLNFVGNAVYREKADDKNNIAQFELIPWLLGQCATTDQAVDMIASMNFWNVPFSPQLPLAQLHWIIADSRRAVTVESVADGVRIYENPTGVLTNNPPFDIQLSRLNDYMHLSARTPENQFSDALPLHAYSLGMGALGLPGDLSSPSRFVRASFVKMHAVSGSGERESVSQFFHILNSVDQQRGCCMAEDGRYEITIYTSCCNATRGIYYYTTYDNHQICAVDMNRENLDGDTIVRYEPVKEEQIWVQNGKC